MNPRRTAQIDHTPTLIEAIDLAAEGIFIQDAAADLEPLGYYFEDEGIRPHQSAGIPHDFEDDSHLELQTDDMALSNFY